MHLILADCTFVRSSRDGAGSAGLITLKSEIYLVPTATTNALTPSSASWLVSRPEAVV